MGLGLEPFAQVDLFGAERVLGPADADGFGPQRQAVVLVGLLGFGEGPVQRGDRGVLARVRSSSWMPPAWSSADSVISSAAFCASRFSSCTVKMTGASGAASLNW